MRKLMPVMLTAAMAAWFFVFGHVPVAKALDASGSIDGGTAMPDLVMQIGSSEFSIILQETPAARALLGLLPLTVEMIELNGNEKYHSLSRKLPSADLRPERIEAGYLMLFNSDCLVLFYESVAPSYSYTELGRVDDVSGLTEALGSGNISVTFRMGR